MQRLRHSMSTLADFISQKESGRSGVDSCIGRSGWNADTTIKQPVRVPTSRKISWTHSKGKPTTANVHASAPGLIIPTSPLQSQASVKSTYTESPKMFQKKINAKRNESQVAIFSSSEKQMTGKLVGKGASTRNATTFQIGGGTFSPSHEEAPARTSSEMGKHHNKHAIPSKSPGHAAHVSTENVLVSSNLRSFVSKESASPKTRKTQVMRGLNSLREPLHNTPEVPYLQQNSIRQKEYIPTTQHSENTKWFRKHVEHGKI